MTAIRPVALAFAQKCLGWEAVTTDGFVVSSHVLGPGGCFRADNFESTWPYIRDFLGTRYWLQMNRDRSTESRWYIRIGVQDVARRGFSRDFVEVIDDDQTCGLMEACVQAVDKLNLGRV